MIVHQTGGLHVGIDYGAAYELETQFFQVGAQGIGLLRGCRELRKLCPAVNFLFAAHERPDIF